MDSFEFTVDGARRAAEYDTLDTWVKRFLSSPGSDNVELGEALTRGERWWLGPLLLPIGSLHRLAGPSGDPVLVPLDDEEWRDDVADMAEQVDDEGWEPPPVVVIYRNDQLVLEDGNHRVEALRRAGAEEVWSVVGFDSVAERDRFTTAVFDSAPESGSDERR